MLKKIRYLIEGLLLATAYRILGILPYDKASAICGKIFRALGPMLSRTKTARTNLQRALPELSTPQQEQILGDMWDNLGRVFGEFPHMGRMSAQEFAATVTVRGAEHIAAAKCGKTGAIYFSGHIANWEMAPKCLAVYGSPLALVYRRGNNPIIDKLIQQTRAHYQSEGVAKGTTGSRQLVRTLKQQRYIGMLLDQKMNTGIAVKFFGRDAMTATAIASLALKFDCPIIPVQVVRRDGIYIEVTIMPPIAYEKTGAQATDIRNIITNINATIEQWIRQNPAQWIWVHNRWPREPD